MKNNIFKIIAILLVIFLVLYEFRLIRFPVTCSQITEPFSVIPQKANSKNAFIDWINQQYTWRKDEKISVDPDYNSPTNRIMWENGNKVYLAHLENETFKLIAIQVAYDYNGGIAPYIDDVLFRNSQQPRIKNVVNCLGSPDFYVTKVTDKYKIIKLWYPDKGIVIFASADKQKHYIENFDVDTLVFLPEPTTSENMLKIFNQLTLTDFSRGSESMKTWAGFDEINFVESQP